MRRHTPWFLVLILASVLAPALPAQGYAPAESAIPDDAEVARLLREVRAEQSRFERIRRANLPWTQSRGGACDPRWGDERIGRFCLMHSDDGKDYVPPPEETVVVEARRHLIDKLREAGERVPWDGWIAGQRVRYTLESGDAESAALLAHRCAAAEWWCAALTGYTHHYAGDAARADSAYSEAMRLIPPSERERWLDLSIVLEGRSLRSYRRLGPEERERFHDRYWQLSRPLFSRPGNDMRSEHLSRNVLDVLQDRAQSTDGITWGEDLREILIRYGWPRGWERVRENQPHMTSGPPSLISYYSNSRTQVIPPFEVLFAEGAAGLTQGEWDVETRRPRSSYVLPIPLSFARWLRHVDTQFAVFRRLDQAVVVAAYDIPRDSLPNAVTPLRSALAIAREEGEPEITHFPNRGYADAVLAHAAPGPALLSLEVLSPEAERAARARVGVDLPALVPGQLALSDLLLLRSGESLPDSLQEAAALARGSDRVRPGESLGVYWEIYGLPDEELQALSVSLRLVDRRGGWLRRAAERVGVVREAAPVRLRWQEQATADGYVARSMAIQIPPVSPGSYILELTVTREGDEPVTAERVWRWSRSGHDASDRGAVKQPYGDFRSQRVVAAGSGYPVAPTPRSFSRVITRGALRSYIRTGAQHVPPSSIGRRPPRPSPPHHGCDHGRSAGGPLAGCEPPHPRRPRRAEHHRCDGRRAQSATQLAERARSGELPRECRGAPLRGWRPTRNRGVAPLHPDAYHHGDAVPRLEGGHAALGNRPCIGCNHGSNHVTIAPSSGGVGFSIALRRRHPGPVVVGPTGYRLLGFHLSVQLRHRGRSVAACG
jgi:hypothetical protein